MAGYDLGQLLITAGAAAVGAGGPLLAGVLRLGRFEGKVTEQLGGLRGDVKDAVSRLERLETKHMGPHGAAGEQ